MERKRGLPPLPDVCDRNRPTPVVAEYGRLKTEQTSTNENTNEQKAYAQTTTNKKEKRGHNSKNGPDTAPQDAK